MPISRPLLLSLRLPAKCGRWSVYSLIAFGALWLLSSHRALRVDFPPLVFDELAEELGHPSFEEIRLYERNLIQHASPGQFTESKELPRYLWFPNASWGSGWNNIFQEQLLNTQLAYLSQRAYVFPDYIPRDHPPFSDTLKNGSRHMLHIPMNAFIAGSTGGGPLSEDGSDPLTRRAVSEEWWHIVCPPQSVKVVNLYETMERFGLDHTHQGEEIMQKWADMLLQMAEPCVSIEGSSVFSYLLTGTSNILSLWPTYGSSPILKNFAWSPLVTAALFDSFHLFTTHTSATPPSYFAPRTPPPYTFTSFAPLVASSPPIPGLLGIHVRRGDYESHCPFLADISAEYNAWSGMGNPQLALPASAPAGFAWPAIPDYFDVPEGMSHHDATMAHCYPAIGQIAQKARQVRERASESGTTNLTAIYIATNGEPAWVRELMVVLKEDGWDRVSSSLDMVLGSEARAVFQAVDMGVLTSAESFIGVGFSSMSSNVVQIRLAAGWDPASIHFW